MLENGSFSFSYLTLEVSLADDFGVQLKKHKCKRLTPFLTLFNDPRAGLYWGWPLDPSSSSLASLPNLQKFSSQPCVVAL